MILLDTNVLSELSRRRPHPAVLDWADRQQDYGVSTVTVEEVACGLAYRPNPRVQDWIDRFWARDCTVFPVTLEIAKIAGDLRGRFRAEGIARTQADMIIAATARVHRLRLATRNVRDFDGCRIGVVNPFDA